MSQPRQRTPDDGAAHSEDFPQRFFAELGARRQALLENRIEDMGVDDVVLCPGTHLAVSGRLFQRLQLFVHDGSHRGFGRANFTSFHPPTGVAVGYRS